MLGLCVCVWRGGTTLGNYILSFMCSMQFVDIMGLQLLPSKWFPWESQMCSSIYWSVLEEIQLQLEQTSAWRLKNLEDCYQRR